MINVADELGGYNEERAVKKIQGIYEQMGQIFLIAKEQGITTVEAANHLAEERINQMLNVRRTFLSSEKSSISKR